MSLLDSLTGRATNVATGAVNNTLQKMGIPLGLGGAGPIPGMPGFTGGAATATAGESRSGDIAPSLGVQTGGGNRGFLNNPVFPGANNTTKDDMNMGSVGTVSPVVSIGLMVVGLVVFVWYLRK